MKVEYVDSAHAIGASGALLMSLWRTVTTHEAMLRFHNFSAKMVAAGRKDPIAFLTVVEANADLPEPAARDELASMFKKLAESVACSALVFEGQGFKAAAVRGVTTGINMLARQPFPHKVFANVDEAGGWLVKQSSGLVSIGDAVDGIATLRARLDARA
jgi:hypothetical protein